MPKILITVWPLTGHIHPNLSIAVELRARGHEVAFYSGSQAQKPITDCGFEFFPFKNVDERKVEQLVLSSTGLLSAIGKPRLQRALWQQWVVDTIPSQVSDIVAVLQQWPADIIVCDPTMWGPFLILGELHSIPVAVFSLIPACFISGKRGPIVGFPTRLPRNLLERARWSILRHISELARRPVRRRANALRRQYGLPPIACSVTDFAAKMPLYLVPGTREFDYGRNDLPGSVHYVGPCLWDGLREQALPDWVAGLPTDQPLIYASEGTVHFEPRVLRAVAQGLADLPVQVIMTTGQHRDPSTLDLGISPLPPNMHVHRWVPLQPLLSRLSALITIGGPSTLMAGIDAGVPPIIVPFYWDHPETAFRIQASGAGIHIPPKECTPQRMRDAVEQLLNNPEYKENTRRLAKALDAKRAAGRAADLIACAAAQPTST